MINIRDKKALENAFAQDFGSPYFPILADLYLQEGDLRRAKMVCEAGLKHSSGNDCGKFILAKVALAEEKFTVAERWLKQVVRENPANFNALRILIRLEFTLKRSPKTIIEFIQHILHYLPKDVESLGWLENITNELPKEKKVNKPKKNDDTLLNGSSGKEHLSLEDIDYDMEKSMATFTMFQILKSQKHYQQAMEVLKMLESKNMDSERISKEWSEIQSILKRNKKA